MIIILRNTYSCQENNHFLTVILFNSRHKFLTFSNASQQPFVSLLYSTKQQQEGDWIHSSLLLLHLIRFYHKSLLIHTQELKQVCICDLALL